LLSNAINFRTLSIVTDVLKNLNFTDVARSHGITQPAVSLQVNKFEEMVGIDLIKRVGNRMILTEAGRQALQLGTSILTLLEDLERIRSLSAQQKEAVGVVTDLAVFLQNDEAMASNLLDGRYTVIDTSANLKRRFEEREIPMAIRFLFDYERNTPNSVEIPFAWAFHAPPDGSQCKTPEDIVLVDLPDPASPLGQAAVKYLTSRGIRFKVMRELAEGLYPAYGAAGGDPCSCVPVPLFRMSEFGMRPSAIPALQEPILMTAGLFTASEAPGMLTLRSLVTPGSSGKSSG